MVVQEVLQRRREPWRQEAQWPATGSWQWPIERIIKADPPTSTWEAAEELNVDHSTVVQHLKQIGKVKMFSKWVPHELIKNPKNNCLEVSSLMLCNNNKPFLNRIVTCNEKHILYDNQWQPAPCSKALPRAKLAPKKGHGHCFGGLLPVWSTVAFWIPAKPLHLRSMLSKLMRMYPKLQCLQPALVNRKGKLFCKTMPDHTSYSQCCKNWMN